MEDISQKVCFDFACPYSKKCGGCDYSGTDYGKQLALKQKKVSDLFKSAKIKGNFTIAPIVGADFPYNYRNKVHAVFSRRAGKTVAGMYREETHEVVDTRNCLLEDLVASQIVGEMVKLADSFKFRIFDEDRGTGFLRHILIRVGTKGGKKQVMVVLVTAEPLFPSKKNFIAALVRKFPCITTIVQNVNSRRTSMVLSDKNIVLYGKGYVEDELLGLTFRISPTAFYQINHEQTVKLYETVKQFAGLTGRERVLDAYSGTGTIGMYLCSQAKSVTAVELNKSAVADARSNAALNGIKNYTVTCADATEYLENNDMKKNPFDVIIMDPPRSGSTERFIEAVGRGGAGKVVYVSCCPETLVRDLKVFLSLGYKLELVQPVDMFPGTSHCEMVCLLSRKPQFVNN